MHVHGKENKEINFVHKFELIKMTEDELFIIDRHPKNRNILIAGGFSGTGFKFALTVGKIISRMATGEDHLNRDFDFDLKLFSINRLFSGTKSKL